VQFARLKIKLEKTADCVIVGYVTKTRETASLALELYNQGVRAYIGLVGTGFSESTSPRTRAADAIAPVSSLQSVAVAAGRCQESTGVHAVA
jgi:ATP-dependent DNA ligase